MKNSTTRFLCLALCLCVVLSLSMPAFATEAGQSETVSETAAETTEETSAETEPETTVAPETAAETEAEEPKATAEMTAPEDETVPETAAETEAEEPKATAEMTAPEDETVPGTTAETEAEETTLETTAETESVGTAPVVAEEIVPETIAETAPETTETDVMSESAEQYLSAQITIDKDTGTMTVTPSGDGSISDYSYSDLPPWLEDGNWAYVQKLVIEEGVTSIGDFAFFGLSNLTSVTIPNTVTSVGYGAFGECTSLTSITIPKSVTTMYTSSFAFCTSLTSITVEDGNTVFTSVDGVLFKKDMTKLCAYPAGKSGNYTVPTGVTTIADSAFIGSEKLTSISIPASVTSIEDYAFDYCTGLTDVYYGGTAEDRAKISIGSDNTYLTNATWHYTEKIEVEPGEVYRLYNPASGEHLLATSDTEISFLTANGWSVDGIMCYMPTSGTPIYRLYNQVSGEHLYTMNESEIENLTAGDWTKDGVMCYSADSSGTPIYRLYNSDAPAISSHLLSTSQEEMDALTAGGGWKIEGIALYALK